LVILDRDIFSIPPAEIGKARVRMTLFDGKVVYQLSDLPSQAVHERNPKLTG
jgi:hypothetical protein